MKPIYTTSYSNKALIAALGQYMKTQNKYMMLYFYMFVSALGVFAHFSFD